jgi:peptidoglycan/xylan/chitin deacetylase (PgdA/CDA1 family)
MMARNLFLRLTLLFLLVALFAASVVLAQDAETTQESTPAALETEPVWDGTYRRMAVPILMYHYVSELPADADDVRTDLTISPDLFRAHMEALFYQGYTPISLYDLDNALLTGEQLPPKPVVLTFDDGYIDHYTNVFPVLEEYGFTGTFFIITSTADEANPAYVSWAQIAEMSSAGMDMESHTKTHPDLRSRDNDFLVYEMLGSIESLSAYTGKTPHMFSYPIGRYDDATLSVAQSLPIWRAVTTQNGYLMTTDNRLELPRLRIHNFTGVTGLLEILRGS